MATTSYVLVMTSYPNHSTAENAVVKFLEAGLVACVNITSILTSIFIWEGKITQANEVLVIMKTQKEKLVELEKIVSINHPYDIPEFIVLPITHGSTQYLAWIDKALK
jgi:periplasmic divalent cation tolerance protein